MEKIVVEELIEMIHGYFANDDNLSTSSMFALSLSRLFKILGGSLSSDNLILILEPLFEYSSKIYNHIYLEYSKSLKVLILISTLLDEIREETWTHSILDHLGDTMSDVLSFIQSKIYFPSLSSLSDVTVEDESVKAMHSDLVSVYLNCAKNCMRQFSQVSYDNIMDDILNRSLTFIESVKEDIEKKQYLSQNRYIANILLMDAVECVNAVSEMSLENVFNLDSKRREQILQVLIGVRFLSLGALSSYSAPLSTGTLSRIVVKANKLLFQSINNFLYTFEKQNEELSFSIKKLIFDFSTESIDAVAIETIAVVLETVRLVMPAIATALEPQDIDTAVDAIFAGIRQVRHHRSELTCYISGVASAFHMNVLSLPHVLTDSDSFFYKYFWQIMEIGERVPKLVAFVALQLSKFIRSAGELRLHIIEELVALLTFGDQDSHSPAHELAFQVLSSFLPSCPETNKYPPIFRTNRIVRMIALSSLYNIPRDDQSGNQLLQHLSRRLVSLMLSKPLLDSGMPGNDVHCTKLRIGQTLCILADRMDHDTVAALEPRIWEMLRVDNLPTVRRLLETYASFLTFKYPSLFFDILEKKLNEYHARPQLISSLIGIAGQLLVLTPKEKLTPVFHKFFPSLAGMVTSHHHIIQTSAQYYMLLFHRRAKNNDLPQQIQSSPYFIHFLDWMARFMTESEDCFKWILKFNEATGLMPQNNGISPVAILSEVRREGSQDIHDEIPKETLELLHCSVDLLRSLLSTDMKTNGYKISSIVSEWDIQSIEPEDVHQLQKHPPVTSLKITEKDGIINSGKDNNKYYNNNNNNNTTITLSTNSDNQQQQQQQFNYQRKITPWTDIELEDDINPRSLHASRKRQSVILVASMIDRVPNLAGLSRTCEIFHAERLVMPSLKAVDSPLFQSISVSADRWCPMEEVPEDDLLEYLMQKKHEEGYTVVGVEQTDTSVSLHGYQFPEKCVLVLGREREGIPTEYLDVIDDCVEIPQLGVIRSLNVHVTGAIVLYEYTRQNLPPSN